MSNQKIDFDTAHEILGKAWEVFFVTLEDSGIDADRVWRFMDAKDCFNDVADCVYAAV